MAVATAPEGNVACVSLRALLLAVALSSTPEPKLGVWSRPAVLGSVGLGCLQPLCRARERIQFDRTCLCITPNPVTLASHKTGGE